MSDYTVLERGDAYDVFEGKWPGEMRFYDEVSNQVKEVTTVFSLAYTP